MPATEGRRDVTSGHAPGLGHAPGQEPLPGGAQRPAVGDGATEGLCLRELQAHEGETAAVVPTNPAQADRDVVEAVQAQDRDR
jgi:hypothetical protein